MANLTITAANVKATATTVFKTGIAAAAITAGQSVYVDGTTGKIGLADADVAGANIAAGVALCNAAQDQIVSYAVGGQVNMGATLVKGTTYVVSATAGAVAPQADLTTGAAIGILGVAADATYLIVNPLNPGVTL